MIAKESVAQLREEDAQDAFEGDASSNGCDVCPFRRIGFCKAVLDADFDAKCRLQGEGRVRARQHIYRFGEAPGRIVVLRRGWAIRYVVAADGRRQVLSILLPGDIVGGELLIREKVRTPALSLTPVEYCEFDIGNLKRLSKEDPDLVWTFVEICFAGREASEARLVDLGRRNAEQRVARLILDLHQRLTSKGLAQGDTIPFPLRQQMIADALGLTQVHVSRVMRSLRQARILKTGNGLLTILDMDALMNVAECFDT
ncbi:MAG: hypothetical protein CMI62_12485 [Parvibaculum sp.]|uniref:Crp/Fnr family transcriptional regulator n=1 Tax=Parvibaculum sp. TaxID=2024848 RepID=UPI000C42DC72|nr:Crp/Fnr family transcriptional regulator [Parvibaculum sp.]MAU61534.1 hypothetical protein [Parvibaculum sp.]